MTPDRSSPAAALVEDAPSLSGFEEFAAALPAGEPERVRALRRAAAERFAALGFPSLEQEAWRYTDTSILARTRFRPAPDAAHDRDLAGAVEAQSYPDTWRAVFVDGRFAPQLSRLAGLPPPVRVGSLAQALAAEPAAVLPWLEPYADFAVQPFVALNTALFADGAFVHVPRHAVLERPLQLLFLSTGGETPSAAFLRNLLVVEEHAQATLLESYAAAGVGLYWNSVVTEIVAGENSVVDHYKVQREGLSAAHVATQQMELGRGSSFASHFLSLGGELVRQDVNARLVGEGVDAVLNGLYMARGTQRVDTHMQVDHAAAHCSSHELYKGILDGQARAVFNGLIHVHAGAQKTDAKQTNRNLLLSREALVNTNPQLLIFADDVRCTHGSTVGQLDAGAIFYLRSRGIGEEAARSLLTYAFASDVVARLKLPALKADLESYLFNWLPMGEVVRQAV
jgi:Fe-S cluster assembly protein SufD